MLHCSVSQLTELFVPDKLPHLRYMTKQEVGGINASRPIHTHDDICELLLIYRGKGIFRNGVQSYIVNEGDLIFCNPHIPHEMAALPDSQAGVYCFGMTGFCRPGLPENHILPTDASFIFPTGPHFDTLYFLSEELYRGLGSKTDDVNAALPLLFAALLSLTLTIPPHSQKYAHNSIEFSIADRVLQYIDQHYTEEFSLEDIAAELNCSAPYISHVFKDVTGYSPMQYRTRCRIGLAQTFLISSDMTSTQIATMVGYDNTNYFNTVFTKIVGQSPIRYRKKYLENMHGMRTQ